MAFHCQVTFVSDGAVTFGGSVLLGRKLRVVGDRVGQRDLPIRNAAVDDLERGSHGIGRVQDPLDRGVWTVNQSRKRNAISTSTRGCRKRVTSIVAPSRKSMSSSKWP